MNKLNIQNVLIIAIVIVTLSLISKELARYYEFKNESLLIIFTTIIGIILIGTILKIKASVHRK
ncbi:MAG: hypothetical protein IPQ18_10185 [Saprospiraceae bacterium]|nr:hypothetical protein [Saprospiraceae bacterium]